MAQTSNVLLATVQAGISASGNGAAINVRTQDQIIAYMNVTSVIGSIMFRLESAPYAAGPFCTLVTGAAISAAGTQALTATVVGSFVRLAWVVVTGPISFDAVSGDSINTAMSGGYPQ